MLTTKGAEADIIAASRSARMIRHEALQHPRARRPGARLPPPHRAGEATVYEFGDCQFDTVVHRLLRAGQEVALTAKEYRLLEHFLQRPGRALTRHSIMQAVWGSEVIVTSRSVDRCVTTLRGKIEPDPQQPTFIQTIRDIGYRFASG